MIKEYVHIGLFIGWSVVGVMILKNSFAGYYPKDKRGKLMVPLDYYILIWLAYLTTLLMEGL